MKEYNFETTPIVDIANQIIIDAVIMNASDIHFDPEENYLKIRIRIDGDLRDYTIVQNKYKRNLITRVKLLAGMNITESRLPQDGAIKSVIQGKDLDLRVSALPTAFGEKIVIRILDYSMSLKGIESLGFTKENYEIILKMLANPNGIILVTGATGSGKSTTVYSMLQRLNKEETNIITVEDPVEMNIEGINQVQVNSEIGLDFANVLRSILRQDPNVILIGEIRDNETAKIAIRASITGHLVLSTLHTNNSLTTIERLLDMDVERYLLSSSLKGIISQNLAKRLCTKCRKKRPTNDTEKRIFKKALNMDVNEIYEPGKCDACRNGYKGRIALQEVLLINDEIRDAINEGKDRATLRNLIYKKNVKTLFQDGLIKVMEGITTMDEVFRLVDVGDDIDIDNIYGEEVKEEIEEENKKENVIPINNNQIDNITNPEIEIKSNDNKSNIPNIIEPSFNFNPMPQPEPVINHVDNNIISNPANTISAPNNIEPSINPNENIIGTNIINNDISHIEPTINPINNITPNPTSTINIPDNIQPPVTSNENIINTNNTSTVEPVNDMNRPVDLDNTQDIFKLRSNIINNANNTTNNNSNNYTDDLINLINQGFFE